MKQLVERMAIYVALIVLSVAFVSYSIAADNKKISGSKITKRLISRNTINPGDDPKHVMNLTVREDTITSSDPDWNNIEGLAYEQSDLSAGIGSHKGYFIIRHKNGDESYLVYQGTDKMVITEGGAWEVSSEGQIKFNGGTGKYKDMKGSGIYSGKTTAKGSMLNWEATIEE